MRREPFGWTGVLMTLLCVTFVGTTRAQEFVADLAPGNDAQTQVALGTTALHQGKVYLGATGPTGTPSLLSFEPTSGAFDVVTTLVGVPTGSFVASTGLYLTVPVDGGLELWRSDGTANGTSFVARVDELRTRTVQWIEANGIVFFSAYPAHVWRTDGSTAGTFALPALFTVQNSPDARVWGSLGPNIYFQSITGSDVELWTSDGTVAGTHVLVDINPNGSSAPAGITSALGKVFFSADDGVHSRELWATDGTPGGTVMLYDLPNGGLFPRAITRVGSNVWFAANDVVHGDELWLSDGTSPGTRLALDITPGTGSTSVAELWPDGSRVWFAAGPPFGPTTFWVSDGTLAGTHAVWSYDSRVESASDPILLGTTTCFVRTANNSRAMKLWTSDGTAAGTRFVTALGSWAQVSPPPPGRALIVGSRCFLALGSLDPATSLAVPRLFVSDGSSAGTQAIWPSPMTMPRSSRPSNFAEFDGEVWCAAIGTNDPLWRSDGTAVGTRPVLDRRLGITSVWGLERVGDGVHFFTDQALWRSDGTPGGTRKLATLASFSTNVGRWPSAPGVQLFTTRGIIYPYTTLWCSDGTSAGTTVLAALGELWGGTVPMGYADGVTTFMGNSGPIGGPYQAEVWRTDSTAAGTVRVASIPGWAMAVRRWRGVDFFAVVDAGKVRIWKTDGTSAGTIALIEPALPLVGNPLLVATDDALVLLCMRDASTVQVWKNTSGAPNAHVLVGQITVAPMQYPGLGQPFELPSRIVLPLDDGTTGTEPWGIEPGTGTLQRLADTYPGPTSGWAAPMTVRNAGRSARAVFFATDPLHGMEPWVTDGTPAGTHLALDMLPGARSAEPNDPTRIGDAIWLGAELDARGNELWRIPVATFGVAGVDDLGGGCTLPAGSRPTLGAELAIPVPGATCMLELRHAPPLALAWFYAAAQRSRTTPWPGCSVQVGEPFVTWSVVTDARGRASSSLTVPFDPALVGRSVLFESATTPAPTTIAISNTLRLVIGAR